MAEADARHQAEAERVAREQAAAEAERAAQERAAAEAAARAQEMVGGHDISIPDGYLLVVTCGVALLHAEAGNDPAQATQVCLQSAGTSSLARFRDSHLDHVGARIAYSGTFAEVFVSMPNLASICTARVAAAYRAYDEMMLDACTSSGELDATRAEAALVIEQLILHGAF